MSLQNGRSQELADLLESLCEERLTADEAARLEQIVLADRAALRFYLDYIDLHGTLHWDTAVSGDEGEGTSPPRPLVMAAGGGSLDPAANPDATRRPRFGRLAAALAACVLAVIGIASYLARPDAADQQPVADRGDMPPVVRETDGGIGRGAPRRRGVEDLRPIELSGHPPRRSPADVGPADFGPAVAEVPAVETGRSELGVVAFVDAQVRAGWDAAAVEPSPRAGDAEWLRRAYLDLVGHIPPVDAAEEFLADADPDKRAKLVERLLDEPRYVRHMTTVWTNLLVGRSASGEIDRPALQKFLRDSFARNRPWNEVVAELISAEGGTRENGAANFLVAHLNNEAVPATAITAKVFLGTNLHCLQCHDHPFNDWKQAQFWELNSFFQQTRTVRREAVDRATGKTLMQAALVSDDVGGPTFFESRNGLMRAAFPRFSGTQVDPDPSVNRRQALGELMSEGEKPQMAQALVNRLWAHFLGAGFTSPVDDMGPHNPPTHPAVLDRLTREFVAGGYDVKQLIRWITGTEAYQLSSRYGQSNRMDDPSAGDLPLFSRAYPKPMTAEQVYDSLLVATKADYAGGWNWDESERQRQEWLQQFVIAFGTDENDEMSTFEGTIPQALMMMNGDLIDDAVSAERGTFLHEVLTGDAAEVEKIRRLCLATLSRLPTRDETAAIRKAFRERERTARARGRGVQVAHTEALQDVFWAYLNSAEFATVP